MKRLALGIGLLVIVAIGSVWIGSQITTLRTTSYSVSVDPDGYSKNAFIIVNDGVDRKIDELLGDFASQDHFAAVIPTVSGFRVRIAGKRWNEETEGKLRDWISQRMHEIGPVEQQRAEQGGRGDGDKPSN